MTSAINIDCEKRVSSWAERKRANCMAVLIMLTQFCLVSQLLGDSLDEGVLEDAFLSSLADALDAYEIDVTSNLNSRDVIGQRIRRPRLGRFPDLPIDDLAASEEIGHWETAFSASQIGGVAILLNENASLSSEVFLENWFASESERRLFVTFHADDLFAAEKLSEVASSSGHAVDLVFSVERLPRAGELYATAAQRLAIDSRSARRHKGEVTELDYLGERVRRKSNSLFSDDGNKGNRSLARREPSVFLKETLGDEFNQSTIEAIIVPGGVALGESASLDFDAKELVFSAGQLRLIDEEGDSWKLPEIEPAEVKALFDFVARSRAIDSDAIVDIDGDGRVRISSALRDTDVGYAIMHADTQPFEYVPNLPVTKSVVIDLGVNWQKPAESQSLSFDVDYEVRFLSADIMRIAQTKAALEYRYNSLRKTSEYSDSWGQYVGRLDENLDYSGLGRSMEEVATYAGWVGLFRRLQDDGVRFLRGRYEFMKIDKSGQKTPVRY
jgi:hypothetical protein